MAKKARAKVINDASRICTSVVDPRQAARLCGVCRTTVYRWADRALNGEPSPLRVVERAANGRIRISRDECARIRRGGYRFGGADEW